MPKPLNADTLAQKSGGYRSFLSSAYDRFVRIRGNPREIALGFALGIFIGMSPTVGLQMAIAVCIAALLGWNKIAAAGGVWISNPLTIPIIYSFTYLVGSRCLGIGVSCTFQKDSMLTSMSMLIKQAPELFLILTVGGIIVGLPLSVASYYIAIRVIERYRRRAQQTDESTPQ